MELIPYDDFARLRLTQFFPDTSELAPLTDWEFMGREWVGEADGFTEFLRPNGHPDELGSIVVDLSALPEHIGIGILDTIRLPLRCGMSLVQVTHCLGAPERTEVIVADRKSYNFTIGSRCPYYVSCTIRNSGDLIHVTVIRKDLMPEVDSA